MKSTYFSCLFQVQASKVKKTVSREIPIQLHYLFLWLFLLVRIGGWREGWLESEWFHNLFLLLLLLFYHKFLSFSIFKICLLLHFSFWLWWVLSLPSGCFSCGEQRLLSSCGAWRASHRGGFSCCSPQAQLFLSTWDLPRSGIALLSLSLQGGFLTIGPLGKPSTIAYLFFISPIVFIKKCCCCC